MIRLVNGHVTNNRKQVNLLSLQLSRRDQCSCRGTSLHVASKPISLPYKYYNYKLADIDYIGPTCVLVIRVEQPSIHVGLYMYCQYW